MVRRGVVLLLMALVSPSNFNVQADKQYVGNYVTMGSRSPILLSTLGPPGQSCNDFTDKSATYSGSETYCSGTAQDGLFTNIAVSCDRLSAVATFPLNAKVFCLQSN